MIHYCNKMDVVVLFCGGGEEKKGGRGKGSITLIHPHSPLQYHPSL